MKILIVDGEPGSAGRLAEGVSRAGCGECFAAENAEQAVEIVNREGVIDLLVVDVFMDGVDGCTLHETIRPHMPNLRTIFLAEYDVSEQADRIDAWPVIAKPVEPAALADFIKEFCPAETAPVVDPLVGATIGNYSIERSLGADYYGNYYYAVQANIQRAAELHALDPARAADPAEIELFLADARTKANAHHPALLSVFEAGQQDGVYFYTSEPRNGSSLAILATAGEQLQPRVVFQLLHSVADLMVYLSHEKIAHEPLDSSHVLVDHRMRTRLVNTAVSRSTDANAVRDMQSLAAMLAPLVATADDSKELRQLLFEMESESPTLRSWNALLHEVKRCTSGATKQPHFLRLETEEQAAIAAAGASRRARRRTGTLLFAGVIVVALAAGGYFYWKSAQPELKPPAPPEGNPSLETMVKIPAGAVVFEGVKKTLPDFWIDTHEVSIGQYADFLAWAERHPTEAAALLDGGAEDSSLVPQGWADEGTTPGYHSIARESGEYEGQKLSLDSPVFGVSWLGARAYAKWKKRRLPTSEEWEKAALGADGGKFPWGPEWKSGSANISAGDAFGKWAPVDAIAADRSPYGVIGTAGNVSEWTSTLRETPGQKAQIVARGGNWADSLLNMRRVQNLEASQSEPTVGFRTVSDTPPEQ